ncbi:uncharacterized protein Dyak_GE10914 [Drosophila yakuba]|uniref:MD-2-related lipid-recognition domain-containing protein n=2 Tax=Drosophila yakuba TaxID=7245 RepID=B4PMN9_DROYA|nr:uncharacterized protein Dyak_GE10914 [Drosophila yakuba]
MSAKEMYLVLSVFLFYTVMKTNSVFEFTNINCTSIDIKVGEYEYCYLKSINRSYKYVSGKYKLYQKSLANIKVNFRMWKRLNGYKPFLYNITVDICQFLKNQKSKPVIKYIFDSFTEYSNMNHSCPYTGDLIVDKLPVGFMNYRMTDVLPIPEGNYMIEFYFLRLNSIIARTQVFFTIS